MVVYTIGHSTHELADFVSFLKHYGVTLLVDVRSVPRSRHVPQFNGDSLAKELPVAGMQYVHLAKLGGLRHTTKTSLNQGWHNASFRGYADYMQTDQFSDGINELLGLTRHNIVAIMCAEALPWRCHRSMIGDALLVRGIEVVDIFDERKTQPEKITDFAHVKGYVITYPASP